MVISRDNRGWRFDLIPRQVGARLMLGSFRNATVRAWLVAWPGGAAVGFLNGVVRDVLLTRRVGPGAANRISVFTLIGLLGAYFALLQRRWPLNSDRAAMRVGASWVALTVIFEFALGRSMGESWDELLGNYNFAEGQLWVLDLLWIATGPMAMRRASSRNGGIQRRSGAVSDSGCHCQPVTSG